MHHKKNDHRSFFPITTTGLCYNILALLLLALGHVRGELAASLAGLFLVSYSLLSVVFCLFSIPVWKSTQLQLTRKRNGSIVISVLHYPNHFLSLLCGTRLVVRFNRVNHPPAQAFFTLSLPVSGEHSRHEFPFPGQGVFVPIQQTLVLHDFASFFQLSLHAPAENCCEPICILPEPEAPATRRIPAGTTEKKDGTSTFVRSENLYETRTYLPGDDPRKINWKIFAHSGSLSIREGELLPPPSAEFFCVFNTKTRSLPDLSVQNSFHSLVNRAATYLLELLSGSKAVTLVLSNAKGILHSVHIDGTDKHSGNILLQTLALLALSPEAASPEECLALIPADASVLFFSLPLPLPEKLSHSRTSCFFGPYPVTQISKTIQDKILSLLFLPPATEYLQKEYYPSDFDMATARFSSEGLNAYIL